MSTPDRGANSKLGHGHGVYCKDLDGDGSDELLCGATLLDQDGKVLWSKTDLPKIKGEHVDSVMVADVDGDGQKEIFFSTGGYLLDIDGNVIWSLGEKVYHGQSAAIGNLRQDVPGLQIVLYDENMSRLAKEGREPVVYVLDKDGKTLLKLGSMGTQRPYLADWDGDDLSELVMVEEDGVGIYDSTGRKLVSIPKPIADPRIERATEFGFVGDVWEDLRDELILFSLIGEEAWLEVYTNGDENPHGRTKEVPKVRYNSKQTANWSHYH